MSTILSRLWRAITPTPITVGSKWAFKSDDGNPWAQWAVEVDAVRDGWVRFRYLHENGTLRGNPDYTLRASTFRAVYRRKD